MSDEPRNVISIMQSNVHERRKTERSKEKIVCICCHGLLIIIIVITIAIMTTTIKWKKYYYYEKWVLSTPLLAFSIIDIFYIIERINDNDYVKLALFEYIYKTK